MRTGRRKIRLGDIWCWNESPEQTVVVTALDGRVWFTDGTTLFSADKSEFMRDFTLVAGKDKA